MNPRTTVVCLSTALMIVTAPAFAAGEGAFCPNAQSPRDLDRTAEPSPYALLSQTSFVGEATFDSLAYLPRVGGAPQTLYRCGQHYHLPIENPQGCKGDAAPGGKGPAAPGQWIEIHTVYAANELKPPGCDPETLGCCTDPPFVVRAFSATVTAEGEDGPIIPPAGRPLAEWSGSTTGKEGKPGECKPAALWSFRLGCEFTVSEAQVKRFHHADPARPVQTGDRLSRDLTLVQP